MAEEASTIGSALPEGADSGAKAASHPYSLPLVTEGFPHSDPAPSGLMAMLRFMESLVGGCEWPDGSLDGLMTMVRAWRTAAYAVRSAAEEIGGHARVVTANNAGQATQSFASFAAALQGGGDAGGLSWLATACDGLADAVQNLIRQKNAARMQFVLSLEFLLATWALAAALSLVTGGGSVAAATATTQAEGFALKAFLRSVAKAVLAGMWFSGGLDAAGQIARIHFGLQKDFDRGEFVKALGEGAVAGGVMGAGGAWIGMGRTQLTKALSEWMSSPGLKGLGTKFLVAGTTGTAGNVAAQAAFDKGHVDWKQAAEFGFGMAGIEVAKDVGRRALTGSNPPPGETPPGHTPPGEGDRNALPSGPPAVSQDGIPNPRIYPHYSERGVGYDLEAQPGDYHWNDPTGQTAHPTTEQPPAGHIPTTELATDHPAPPAAQNIPHYDITSVGRDVPAVGTDHTAAPGPTPAVVMGMDNAAPPGGSRPNVPAVPDAATPVPARTEGPALPVRGQEGRPVAGGPDGRPVPPAELSSGTPAPATPARTPVTPRAEFAETAHRALTEARQIVAPDGLLLQDGSVRLTDRNGRTIYLPEDVLHHAEQRLTSRAADGATVERLRAEAAAWVGAEIARTGHQPPADGALDALGQLSDHSPDNVAAAAELSREVRGADPTRRPHPADHPSPADPTLRPHLNDGVARNIVERAEGLAADQAAAAHGHGPTGGVLARPEHQEALGYAEVRSALERLRPSDLGRGVTGWSWSEDGTTLHVQTEAFGTRDLQIVIAEMPESLSAMEHGAEGEPSRLTIAPWAMSREAAESGRLSPAEVRQAGEVLPQVLLHGITDTAQRAAAAEARSGQGVVRRLVSGVRSAVRNDGQVHRLFNDHRYLTREWRDATDPADRASLARRIRQVGQDLRTAGQTPPEPPWVGGADGVLPGREVPTPRTELINEVRGLVDSLGGDVAALQERVATHTTKALEADRAAEAAREGATTAAGQQDRGAYKRARDAMDQVDSQEREGQRHRAIADRYQEALNEAYKSRITYRALLASLERAEAQPLTEALAQVYADGDVILATEGRDQFAGYEAALEKALPEDVVTPDAVLTSRVPLRSELTGTANRVLADTGVQHTFTAEGMENWIRAESRNALSRDGALLPVGRDGIRLRVRLRLRHLVEVLNPEMRPAETINGGFTEGGQWNGATANHSLNSAYELDLSKLSQLVPDLNPTVTTIKGALKLFGPSIEGDRGSGWSESANDLYDARSGTVVNIRDGRMTVVEGVPVYEVSVVFPDGRETAATRVDMAAHDDATSAQVLVSDAHTLPPPEKLAQLPPDQRQRVPLPDHAVTEVHGLEDLYKNSLNSLEAENVTFSDGAREQLRQILTREAKLHLQTMTGERGLPRVIPGADLVVRLKARVDVNQVDVRAASTVDFMERVDVGFIGTTGSESYNVSTAGSSQFPLNPFSKLIDLMPGHEHFDVGPAVKLTGSRSVTHTETVNVGGVVIPVTVARHVGHTQSVVFHEGGVVIEAHFYSLKENRVLSPVVQEVSGELRFAESDAHDYGFPVDDAAIRREPTGEPVRRPDGSVVLRDDPVPGAPPGRKAGLPSWNGDEPGQLRGSGHTWVSKVTGVEESLGKMEPTFKKLGIVSPVDANGLPAPASRHPDRMELIGQTSARRKLEELPGRLLADYGQATQESGIPTELKHLRLHGTPKTYHLRTYVEQDFGGYGHEGVDNVKQVIKLGIASESNGETSTEAVTWNGGGGVSLTHKPLAHESGAEEGIGADGGGNHTSSTSESRTDMGNNVDISESTGPLSKGTVPVTVHQVLTDAAGNEVAHTTSKGFATIETPADWLPEDNPEIPLAHPASIGPAQRTSDKVLDRATAQEMDVGDILKQVRDKLPEGMRLPGGVRSFLSEKGLRTHMDEWRGHGYETSVLIDPNGLQPRRLTLVVKGVVGPSEFVQAVDLVDGKINLTIEGATSTESRSGGWKATGSAGGAAHHGADGARTDGGSGDVYKGKSTSTSTSESESSGRERLTIRVDPKLIHRAVAYLDVEIRDPATGTSEHVTVNAPMIHTVPESAALDLHSRGEMPLPLHHMADVMQRFLDGNLLTDQRTVARLVAPYLARVAEAAHNNEPLPRLAAGHTPEAFFDKVLAQADVGTDPGHGAAEQRAGRELPPAEALAPLEQPVAVADQYQHSIATSLFDELELTGPDGTPMKIIDGVRQATQERSPAAWQHDPSIRQRLNTVLGLPRWEGFADGMLDPGGFDRDLRVRVDADGRSEVLSVRAQMEFGDDAVVIGTTDHVVPIFQDYGYRGGNRVESSSGVVGGDLGGADGSAGPGADGSVGTAKNLSVGGTDGHMLTRLKRLRWFDAAAANAQAKGTVSVRQSVTVKITVDQLPLLPGTTKVDGSHTPRPVTVELTGHVVRMMPARTVRPVEAPSTGAELAPASGHQDPLPVPDSRPIKIPGSRYYVEWVEGSLAHEVMHETFVDLLGEGSDRVVARELARKWSALARHSPYNFERMAGEAGYPIRIRFGSREATVVVHLDMSDLRVGDVGGAEISEVDRSEHTTAWSASVGHVSPLSRSVEVKDGVTGLGTKQSSGAQASESVSDNSGARIETSRFSEVNRAPTVQAEAAFRMDFTSGRREVHHVAHGEVYLTMAGPELDAARAAQEAGDPRGATWDLGTGHDDGWRPFTREKWNVVDADPARPSAALTQALMEARLANREIRIEVRTEGGEPHRYRALPDGTLLNGDGWTDGGFANAFQGLHETLRALADQHGLNLRQVFERSPVDGTLADKVRAELMNRGVTLPPEAGGRRPSDFLDRGPHGPWRGGLPGEGISAGGGFGGGFGGGGG
ncbi:hypothetical protein [Actinomadura sp. DC4]|uniref:WXG100-like domain-containing protein n=1 Tax=Actinomadura sp. DC4 TaxID=3055069 RepID=UPI0025B27A52|nr:hypothetical protein [Actinomadura sp. DC4]MDN3351283.1 hypothetical protein [Actinomadura sp. DC4]